MPAPHRALIFAALLLPAATAAADWFVARNGRFEVYSQESEAAAVAALQRFEQLRAVVRQETGLDVGSSSAIRVVGFRGENEYAPYRVNPTADAYYLGGGGRDYIVLPSLGEGSFPLAAHEFAHLIQHAEESHLPPWLSEGLADVFSTVRIGKRGARIGGELPGRLNVLRRRPWIPWAQLLALPAHTPLPDERASSEMFYAQSWALTDMLALAPAYRPGFAALLRSLGAGAESAAALEAVYGKPLAAVTRDLKNWVQHGRFTAIPLVTPEPEPGAATVRQTPASSVALMMAGLLLTAGELKRAESAYRTLAGEVPQAAEVWAGLGAIAAASGQFDQARALWRRALDQGLNDAEICFRYAELLGREGGSQEERLAALRRAVASQPDFDDARWVLALVEENLGHYEASLADLQAMREVAPARAYAYWCAIADALTGLGRSEEAQAAARRAFGHASTAEERARATQLEYMARTRLAVRLTRDAAGNTQMVTTRVPNDDVGFNPFIEPSDDLRRVQGTLREIQCVQPAMRVTVDTATGLLTLTIPDPGHVQMRNAPAEFVCGPQHGEQIIVEYAAGKNNEGIVRGLEFR